MTFSFPAFDRKGQLASILIGSFTRLIHEDAGDPKFEAAVSTLSTLYNNDYDESSKMGKGGDNPYVESRFGRIINAHDHGTGLWSW